FRTDGPANPKAKLEMQLRLAHRNRDAVNALLHELYDPNSPKFHQWLTRGEFGHRFGATREDLRQGTRWLKAEGFLVKYEAPRHVPFTGRVEQAQRTCGVNIARYGTAGAYSNTTDPRVPSEFAGLIARVMGLDNMMRAVPASRQRTSFQQIGAEAS